MIRENGFFYTGKGVSEATEKWMLSTRNLPFIVVGGSIPPSFEEVVHACAIEVGLPEIKGYYGYDFAAHEFIRLPDADKGVPDEWPSRKLEDILGRARKAKPMGAPS